MNGVLSILTAGPSLSLQDMGRQGYHAYGLTRGGAADTLALHEGAVLLRQSPNLAVLEMVGLGGTFQSNIDTSIALTGAHMAAEIDGVALVWNASHFLPAGAKLTIGGTQQGTYGYLSVSGGFDTPLVMGARSSHLTAGVGKLLEAGQKLPLGQPKPGLGGNLITPDPRLSGGEINIVASVQTEQFSPQTLERFAATQFQRDARGNRQGVRMASREEGFFVDGGLSIISEVISEGDIQITGDGAPYVLMCECQTTGGYPRIGTVLPSDLPRVAQASVGAALSFKFLSLQDAVDVEVKARAAVRSLPGRVQPLVRDPREMNDLLSYQLVSGMFSATADPYSF